MKFLLIKRLPGFSFKLPKFHTLQNAYAVDFGKGVLYWTFGDNV